jgi:hypothetical protein
MGAQVMLTVYTMKKKGESLMETDEGELLDEFTVHYYKVRLAVLRVCMCVCFCVHSIKKTQRSPVLLFVYFEF